MNLITTMPSRHSGDQVHKVGFFAHCTKKGRKGESAYKCPAREVGEVVALQVDRLEQQAAVQQRCKIRQRPKRVVLEAEVGEQRQASEGPARE